jgi:hypothetical protein
LKAASEWPAPVFILNFSSNKLMSFMLAPK